jgi:hypothetical protein
MAEFIRLAEMPKGKAFKTLSKYEKIYIDENHLYEPVTIMADVLRINYLDVDVYCKNMKYRPASKIRAKPKQTAKINTFDVDTYKTWTI